MDKMAAREYVDLIQNSRSSAMLKKWRPVMPSGSGPNLLPTQSLFDLVRHSPRLKTLIDAMTKGNKASIAKLSVEVVAILNEIALGRSLSVIRGFGLVIECLLPKMNMSLCVNQAQVDEIKRRIPKSNPIIFLPSHRSYVDFVLFSYICFVLDIEVPAVAAGMDFKHMKGLGKLMNQAGAFFMRRKFDNLLYWYVFKEFIEQLMMHYRSGVEFFIEGTRSRTMKALPPKIGLLSMTLEPFLMGRVVDISIIPVSISYERPLEEQLFAYELLGVPKPKESTMRAIRSILSLGNQHYGHMYFHYHQPISVKEFFGARANRFQHSHEPPHVQQLTRTELDLVQDLADHVIDQQQRYIVIQIFNLAALYISYRSQRQGLAGLTCAELRDQVLVLARLFERLGAFTNVEQHRIDAQLRETLKVHESMFEPSNAGPMEPVKIILKKPVTSEAHQAAAVKFKAHHLLDITLRECLPLVQLQIYVNPCLYWTAWPALMVAAIRRLAEPEIEKRTSVKAVQEQMDILRCMFATEFLFTEARAKSDFDTALDLLGNLRLIEVGKGAGRDVTEIRAHRMWSEEGSKRIAELLMASVAPYLCTYYQVVHSCHKMNAADAGGEWNQQGILERVQADVEQQLLTGSPLTHPYCLCLEAIGNAVAALVRLKALHVIRSEGGGGGVVATNGDRKYGVDVPVMQQLHTRLFKLCAAIPFAYLNDLDLKVMSKGKL